MNKNPARRILLAAAATLLPGLAAAQLVPGPPPGFHYDAGLALRETFTDNAQLQPAGYTHSDFISEVTPRLRVSENAGAFRGDLAYAPTVLLYQHEGTETRNFLNGKATAQLVQNFLYVDAMSMITQERLAAIGANSTESNAQNSNRLESRNFGVSPYIRTRTDSGMLYSLRDNYSWTTTNADGLGNFRSQEILGHVESAPQTLGWQVDAEQHAYHYTGLPDLAFQVGRAMLDWRAGSDLTLSAGGGYEHNNVQVTSASNAIYGGGLDWRPSLLTRAQVRWEHRFFGANYLAGIAQRGINTAWSFNISRGLGNFVQSVSAQPVGDTAALIDNALQARVPDPNDRDQQVNDRMRNDAIPTTLIPAQSYLSRSLFIYERAELTGTWLGQVNSLAITLYRSSSRDLLDPTSPTTTGLLTTILANTRVVTRGAGITYLQRLSPTLNATVFASRALIRIDFPSDQLAIQNLVRVQATQKLNQTVNVFAGARVSTLRTDTAGSTSFTERAAFGGLDLRFF